MQFVKHNIGLLLLLLGLVGSVFLVYQFENKEVIDFASQDASQCNVSVLAIEGVLDTSASEGTISSLEVAQSLRRIDRDKNKALVLLIDSWGGSAAAAEEINYALKGIGKPKIAMARGTALSGAYWIAATTDYIVAQRSSLIGGIGVTLSYLDEVKLNEEEGYTFNEIVSGRFKETGDVNKPLSQDERAYLQSLTDEMYEIFKADVMESRQLSAEEFAPLADAQTFLGDRAKELKLIDGIGGLEEVKQELALRLEMEQSDIVFCEPEKIQSFEESNRLFGAY